MKETQIKSIDNYRVVGTIYKTPEGILYKAIEEVSGNNVLIKIYYPSMTWSEDILNEFFDRIGYFKFIEHDYILPILDVGKDRQKPYVVYPLNSFIFFRDFAMLGFSQKDTIILFSKFAEVLDFLHKQEIIHGSLNIDHILVDDHGNLKLFDFGLSGVFKKLLANNVDEGFTNLSVSDIRSSSPEQILGHTPNRASDIYAFGMIYYYFLFGRFLFDSQMSSEIAVNHLSEIPVRVEKTSGKVSATLLGFIQKCIQPDPARRFKSFAEMQKILGHMLKGWPQHFSYKKRFLFVLSKRQIQKRARLLTGAVLASALGFALYLFQDRITAMLTPAPLPAITAALGQLNPTPVETEVPNLPSAVTATMQPVETANPAAVTPVSSKPTFGNERSRQPGEVISVFNVGLVEEYSRLGFGRPEDVDISSNPDYFAVATSAGVFIYYRSEFDIWLDPGQWVTSIAFSTDGETLAVGLVSGDIQLWDWRNDKKIATLSDHTAKVTKVLFSKNDLLLYSASFDHNIIVWDIKSQEIVHKIAAHSGPVNNIAVSSDGRTLISCSNDQMIRFWDLASGKKLFEFRVPEKIEAVAFSPDDNYFAVGGETGFIHQWDVKTQQLRTDPIPVQKRIWSLEYLGDDSILAGIDDGEYKTFNTTRKSYDGSLLRFDINEAPLWLYKIFGFGFKFDSSTASNGTEINLVSIRWDGSVEIQGRQILRPVYDNIDKLDISRDGSILAASGARGITTVWDINNNRQLYQDQVRLPFGDPIAPDGSSILVGLGDYYQSISLPSASMLKEYYGQILDGVISYADDGNILISGSLANSRAWDYSSGYEIYYSAHPDTGCRLTLSGNNSEILQINSAAGTFQSWGEEEKKICANSQLYRNTLTALSINHKMLAYLSSKGLIEGVDPVTNKLLWRYKPETKVTVMAVSPDGSVVVTGGENGKMVFIDSRTGTFIYEITGNFGALNTIEFSEDGMKIATTGFDGTVRLFGVVEK